MILIEKIKRLRLNKLTLIIINLLFLMTVSMFVILKEGYQFTLSLIGIISVLYSLHHLFFLRGYKNIIGSISKDYGVLISSFLLVFMGALFFFIINDESIKYLDNPSKLIGFSAFLILALRFPIKVEILFLSICFSSIASGLLAIYQFYFLSQGRAFLDIMAIQAGDIAMSLGLFSVFISHYYKENNKKVGLYLGIISVVFGVLASFLSGSRGGWVCLPILLIFYTYYYRYFITKKIILISSLAGVVILLLFIMSNNLSSRITSVYSEIKEHQSGVKKDSSIGFRLELWKGAFYAWQDKPILGWGTKGIEIARKRQGEEGKVIPNLYKTKYHAHNQYLEELSVRGILGLSIFLIFLISPFTLFYKTLNSSNLEVRTLSHLGILHIYLISTYCLTQVFFAHNSGWIFYLLIIVGLYSPLHKTLKEINSN